MEKCHFGKKLGYIVGNIFFEENQKKTLTSQLSFQTQKLQNFFLRNFFLHGRGGA